MAAPKKRPRPRCWDCESAARALVHLRIDGWRALCKKCVSKRRLVTLRDALKAGFPLDTLRKSEPTVMFDDRTMLHAPIMSLDVLESLACSDPNRRDVARAKLDAKALTSDARRARAALLATHDALARANAPDAMREGPHLALVSCGAISQGEAMALYALSSVGSYRQADGRNRSG